MSRREESLLPVAKQIESSGGQALSVPADTGMLLTSPLAGAQTHIVHSCAQLHASNFSWVLHPAYKTTLARGLRAMQGKLHDSPLSTLCKS